MLGWIGDSHEQLFPHFFADADFAGDLETKKSTSGLKSALSLQKIVALPLKQERNYSSEHQKVQRAITFTIFDDKATIYARSFWPWRRDTVDSALQKKQRSSC